MILTQHLHWLVWRRFSCAVELSKPSFARGHSCFLPQDAPGALSYLMSGAPDELSGSADRNINARMRFQYGIVNISQQFYCCFNEDLDDLPDRLRRVGGFAALPADIRR
jgi:hypothetical protein